VARWLRENTDLALNEVRWSVAIYARYLKTMFRWADELAVAADELEACIFFAQAGLVASHWAPADQASRVNVPETRNTENRRIK